MVSTGTARDESRKLRWWEPQSAEEPEEVTEVQLEGTPAWRLLGRFLGPGIMIAIAYIDPGNYATDLSGGSRFQFRLLWSVLFAHVLGYVFQVLVVLQSLGTGRTLSEECAVEYPSLRVFLWLTAEISSVASDLSYVMGTATAFKILFHLPMVWGVLLSASDTLVFMAIQALGHRRMELFCGLLGLVVTACCLSEICMTGLDWEVLTGFVPFLHGLADAKDETPLGQDARDYVVLATSIIGASVCPPNYFLHSALVHTRRFVQHDEADLGGQLRTAVKYNAAETAIGIFFAFLINAAILIVSAKIFYTKDHHPTISSLKDMSAVLKSLLGPASSYLFALSIFAGGQSASVVGTLASQFILEGFMNIRIKMWIRRLVTRVVSIAPAFLITLAAGDQSAAIIENAQVVVNFAVPFTLIPILKFTSSSEKMGQHRLSQPFQGVLWAMLFLVSALNIGSAVQIFTDPPFEQYSTPVLFALLIPYLAIIGYMVWKPARVAPSEKGLARQAPLVPFAPPSTAAQRRSGVWPALLQRRPLDEDDFLQNAKVALLAFGNDGLLQVI